MVKENEFSIGRYDAALRLQVEALENFAVDGRCGINCKSVYAN